MALGLSENGERGSLSPIICRKLFSAGGTSAIRDLYDPSFVETCFLDVALGACMGISASASTIGCIPLKESTGVCASEFCRLQ